MGQQKSSKIVCPVPTNSFLKFFDRAVLVISARA